MRRTNALVTAGLVALLPLAGCAGDPQEAVVTGVTAHDEDGMNGAVLTEPYVVPDVTLTATDGQPFSLTEDTTAPLTLVFFGYTHCPDICHVVMADITSAMTRLSEAHREQVGMVFVTTDPARDDPEALRAYLDRFDPSFEGLTGRLPTIVDVGKALGVPVEKGARLPSGGYEVTHGTQIVAIGARDRAPIVWTQGTSPAELAEDIAELVSKGSTGGRDGGGS